VFVIYPVASTVYLSFTNRQGHFVGLQNYATVFDDRDFWNPQSLAEGNPPPYGAFIHNIIWIVIHLPLSLFFGMFLAVLLRDIRGGAMIKSIVFLGFVIPLVIGGVLMRFIYDDRAGVVNAFLRSIGLGQFARTWTAFPDTALISLILGSVWIWTGFSMIVYSAGLEGIPIELFEAAKIDGASRWRTFWRVTVPMMKSATIVVVTMTLLWELKIFDIVWAIYGGGGPSGGAMVMSVLTYLYSFLYIPKDYYVASAIATLLTIMTLGFAAYLVTRMVKH
jgi:multiple sugar transport system permease protein